MLYTGKGDNGTTKLFNCPDGARLPKSDLIFEVLGVLDELNSLIGYSKSLSLKSKNKIKIGLKSFSYEEILETLQQNLFCIQAEVGGANIHLKKEHILFLEDTIKEIEKIIPPIKSFILTGGGELSAYIDINRTIARKAERQLVLLHNNKKNKQIINKESLTYLNRLSSVLYALARLINHQEGFIEKNPKY